MEMLLISSNKLKIIISKDELDSFDLSTDMLDYGNTETKRMLWDILNKAKHTIGFDPDGYRIFVQLYPSNDGSCELFVTKISSSESSICDIFSHESYDLDTDDDIDDSESNEASTNSRSVYEMESLNALCNACRRMASLSISEKSAVYIYNGNFYLILYTTAHEFSYPIDELSFIGEYGSRCSSQELIFNICEFGDLICENKAIETFSEI